MLIYFNAYSKTEFKAFFIALKRINIGGLLKMATKGQFKPFLNAQNG